MLFRSKRQLLFICAILISILVVGCTDKTVKVSETTKSDKPVYGGYLRTSLPAPVQNLDPAHFFDSSSVEVGKELFNGLVSIDPKTMKVVSAHAERWEVKDGLVYLFYISKGAKFHNGKEVTAEDFKFSFERILDPNIASEISGMLLPIKGAQDKLAGKTDEVTGIRVKDKYLLEIELLKPDPNFLYVLAYPGFSVVEKDSIREASEDFGTQAALNYLVGSGPFKIGKWDNNMIQLNANEEFFDGRPYLDGVTYRFIKDETTALNEFKADNLDILDRLPPAQVKAIKQQYKDLTKTTDLLESTLCMFNVQKPPFDNIYLRKAVNYAINREDIVFALGGQAKKGTGILPTGIEGFNGGFIKYDYNKEKALEMLDKAGYPNGQGLPEIEFKYNYTEINQRTAEIIQANLRDIGIKVRLVSLEPAILIDDLIKSQSQMFRLSWVADYPGAENFLYPLFYSGSVGITNLSFYKNNQFDTLMNEASSLEDLNERKERYKKAHQIIMNDSVAVVLYYPTHTDLINSRVQNLSVTKMDTKPLRKVWLADVSGDGE